MQIVLPQHGDNFLNPTSKNMEESLTDICKRLRKDLLTIGEQAFAAKKHSEFDNEQRFPDEHSEAKANITLAFRHIEDARMRLGKVIQAKDGGVSCYKA
jgi:hypothetical protein